MPEIWLVVIGAALWGVDPLFRVLLLKYLTSTQIVLLEHIILFFFAAPVLIKRRHELWNVRLLQVGALLFLSWGGSAIATILFTQGLATGDLNAVLLLQKLQPLIAIIMARYLLKERLPQYFGVLIALALVGTYLLTFGWSVPDFGAGAFVQVGSLLSVGAAILWGGSTVMGRYMLGSMSYETVTSLRFILALPLLLVITASGGGSWIFPTNGGEQALMALNMILQALLPGLLSLLLYYKGLSVVKASYATLAELSFPMVGVIINWIAFNQMITTAQLTGFVLIWATLYMISKQQSDGPSARLN
ncbi:drug/metabolite transporter (DMT)-like permease [Paenibacillus phyllosphaerae]|uniref:Drug/metabolite transporter (DMT)-like permease n=2 Tax=Paenibacillus phyllosphaerae TaxID=274593 RepID=A0A7W5AZ05_9BACL|nr:DMT family transporter [Paenibacillus phyllosphaerae]MBB3111227.1 drug/metabolite transporter (DMT)-like permease [Paenibacillus phyllosphaerae]